MTTRVPSRYRLRLLCRIWILLPMVAVSCKPSPAPSGAVAAPPAKVTAAKPLVMPIVEWDEFTGRLDAIDSVEVRARVSGYLRSTHFEEGQIVQRGDLLAIIDPRPFENELNAAKARVEEAKAHLAEANAIFRQAEAEKADAQAQLSLANVQLERNTQLLKQSTLSRDEYDVSRSRQEQTVAAVEAANAQIESARAGIATAQAAIRTAQSLVDSAELNLQYTQVRAPISGRISRRYVTEGNLISGGSAGSTLLTTIVSLNPIHAYFDANEQEFLKYARLSREGTRMSSRDAKNPVFIALVDEKGFPHRGHMDFVDNRIDPNTGTMRGRAIFPNDDQLLTPGLFVKVRLPGSGRYEAILIPDEAIGIDQTNQFVFKIDAENKAQRQPITTGSISHGLRIVRSGLDGSETIIISGLQRVFAGAVVEPTLETITPAPSDLPDEYQPVPAEQWISRRPDQVPKGIKANIEPYRELNLGKEEGT